MTCRLSMAGERGDDSFKKSHGRGSIAKFGVVDYIIYKFLLPVLRKRGHFIASLASGLIGWPSLVLKEMWEIEPVMQNCWPPFSPTPPTPPTPVCCSLFSFPSMTRSSFVLLYQLRCEIESHLEKSHCLRMMAMFWKLEKRALFQVIVFVISSMVCLKKNYRFGQWCRDLTRFE